MDYKNEYKIGEYTSTTDSRLLNNLIRKENTNYSVCEKGGEFVLLKDMEEIYKSESFSDMASYIRKLINVKDKKNDIDDKNINVLDID